MPDDSPDLTRGSIDLFKIMMLTGAAIGIFSVFQLWISTGSGFTLIEYSGYELFTKAKVYPDEGYFLYLPLMVLILSAAAVGVSILSFTKHERIGAAAGSILGIMIVISTLLFVLYPESTMTLRNDVVIIVGEVKLI